MFQLIVISWDLNWHLDINLGGHNRPRKIYEKGGGGQTDPGGYGTYYGKKY